MGFLDKMNCDVMPVFVLNVAVVLVLLQAREYRETVGGELSPLRGQSRT